MCSSEGILSLNSADFEVHLMYILCNTGMVDKTVVILYRSTNIYKRNNRFLLFYLNILNYSGMR